MKNIQVIDGAINCFYPIYQISNAAFRALFPGEGQTIEFAEDFFSRLPRKQAEAVFASLWGKPLEKSSVEGIHGTLFCGLLIKKEFYPSKTEPVYQPAPRKPARQRSQHARTDSCEMRPLKRLRRVNDAGS